MEEIKLVNFIDLELYEKKLVLQWRNNPIVREWMYNQEEITIQDHLNFIENLKDKKDKLYFLVKKDKKNIGVIDFTQIIENKSLYMGIYANPSLKGSGKELLETIIDYSFNYLNVKKIFSEVFSDNIKAYQLYEKYNFKKVGIKTVNNKEVICMELIYENR